MNASEIVDILTETGITADDFVKSNPDMLAYFTFSPAPGSNTLAVKRWSGGSYYYIGTVRNDPHNDVWYAYETPPVGRRHYTHIVAGSEFRKTRYEAAADLWSHYKQELDTPLRVR